MINVSTAFVLLPIVIVPGSDDNVRVSIAVHVTGVGNRPAELRARLIALNGPPVSAPFVNDTERRAPKNKSPSFVYTATIIIIRTHNNLGIAVSVYVTRRRYRVSELAITLVAFSLPFGGISRTGGRTVVHKSMPLIGQLVIVIRRANDDVSVSVTIYVPGIGNRPAERRIVLVPLSAPPYRPIAFVNHSVRGTPKGIDTAFVRLAAIEVRCANDNVGVSVAIQVPCTRDRVSKVCIRLVPLMGPGIRVIDSVSGAVIHPHPAFVSETVFEQRRTYDNISVSVAVHVPGVRDRKPEIRGCLVALRCPIVISQKTGSRPVINKRPPFVRFRVVVPGRANDHVGESITVHVPGGRNAAAKVSFRLVAFHRPRRSALQAPRSAVVNMRPPLLFLTIRSIGLSQNDVRVTVSVDVPRCTHSITELHIAAFTLCCPGRTGFNACR